MAITQAFCTTFKRQLFEGAHDFSVAGHTFKMALYTSSATLNATTSDYSVTNEVVGTNYVAGGIALTNIAPSVSGTTGLVDFSDAVFSNVTLTARGALIYNTTTSGGSGTTDACVVLDFGTDKSQSAADFTVQFPAADASNAIIRIT